MYCNYLANDTQKLQVSFSPPCHIPLQVAGSSISFPIVPYLKMFLIMPIAYSGQQVPINNY